MLHKFKQLFGICNEFLYLVDDLLISPVEHFYDDRVK